jgi:radical SAM superfamily enzyme YgiQ (UPF0313 family)
MKVFLVSPNERNFLWNAGDRMPLGLLYVSSALTGNQIDNEVFDLNHFDTERFVEEVKEKKPDLVGLSIPSSPSYNQMRKLAEKIKPYAGSIVAGGPHVSALPDSLDGLVDSVVNGYGEEGILEVINGRRGKITKPVDINKFPLPNRQKLGYRNYAMWTEGLKTATIITSRGCPYNCVFCASHERKVQFRDPENVKEEIRQLRKQDYQAVYVLDENFSINRRHLEEITKVLKKEDMKYKMEMRSGDATREIAEELVKTGCLQVNIGCESGDNEILTMANTGKNVEENREAIHILHKYGIPVKGFFIIGLPGETEETARKTIEFAEEMRHNGLKYADFYTLTPFPGNPVWDNPEKYGLRILSRDFDSYLQKGDPVIETENLSKERISKILGEARARWKR